ncbi:hypothetical protein AB0L62_17750 [Nocardia asteroides]|uniref:hypothetical protein n=1 Tax=Nocardia asteroides TaxID=1824 RepID=UPI003437A650
MQAEAWNAVGSFTTAGIALVTVVVAGLYARKQVAEMRALREEQAQPYVVASMELSSRGSTVLLVFKNYGTTGAHDIRVNITPTPQNSAHPDAPVDGGADVAYPAVLPFLAPGQEWRTYWDHAPQRRDRTALPERHVATVAFKDSKGRELEPTTSILDWGVVWNHAVNSEKTIGHLVKEVEKLNKSVAAIGDAMQKEP